MNSKVPLQGAELEAFFLKERLAKEKQAAQQAVLARSQRMLEADEDESDSDLDSEAEEENDVNRAVGGDMMDTSGDMENPGRRTSDKSGEGDWGIDGDEGLTKQLLSFDIYLKGNVSKANSFFKNVGSQVQRFRMFPYVEKKRRVDEYGETIDVGMWLRKGKVFEEDADSDEVKDLKKKQADEEAKVYSATIHQQAELIS
jgi:cleavage and polyadenylation specificity factor subunit 2